MPPERFKTSRPMLCTPTRLSNFSYRGGVARVTAIPLKRKDNSSATAAGGRTRERSMAAATTTTAPKLKTAATEYAEAESSKTDVTAPPARLPGSAMPGCAAGWRS
ncbi:Uncharacterised protein [Mycobacteroides abscessus subsp. abscessus]|nr:Uncharacterised protein [Mycobacteroides abscessus subsp. abscessus]